MTASTAALGDRTWKALSDPVCRGILDLLRTRPRTTGELCGAFRDLTRFKVMNHMAALKDAGLIRVERQGRERVNHLEPAPLCAVYRDWLKDYEAFWDDKLERLKHVAERHHRRQVMDGRTAEPAPPLVPIEVSFEVAIDARAAIVFAGLTDGIGEWWGAPYLQTDAAVDMVLEPRPGGMMLERTRGDGGAVWGFVQEVRRDRLLVIEGRMGISQAVFARSRFELSEANGETTLRFHLSALGRFEPRHHGVYADGLRDLLGNRLKAFVEHGTRPGIRAAG